MAIVNESQTEMRGFNDLAMKFVWTPLTTTNDTGRAILIPGNAIKSIQFSGTFGAGGTVVFEGSNDGTNFVTLTDPQGNAISKTSAGIEAVEEYTLYVRPRVTAGDGTTSITATLGTKRG